MKTYDDKKIDLT